MSVSTFCHLFRKQMHTSPVHFFIRMKMHRACELLDTTDLSVHEIGARVGYEDPFYFCRIFKKMMGQTASEYRDCVRTLDWEGYSGRVPIE
jgi:AraC-like DNA-binding protein